MPDLRRLSPSEDATAALARSFAQLLRPGDVVTLNGPMGAGKTTFVRALATALGVAPGLVSSPTFVLINVYPATGSPGSSPASAVTSLIHIDAYRIGDVEELSNAGWDRLFDSEGRRPVGQSASVIEWAQRVPEVLPEHDVTRVTIEPMGVTDRQFEFALPASWVGRAGLDEFLLREPTKCPTTGVWVAPTCATYPFANDRARMADLNRWFTESYSTSRPIAPEDEDA